MSKKKKIVIAASILGAVILVALGIYQMFFAPKGYTQDLSDPALNAPVVADYTKDESVRTETFASGSKGYSWENGDPFNVWWKAENAVYDGGKLVLKLSEMTQKEQVWASDGTASDCLSQYYGAEVRSEHYYGYGDFQVRMKPAAVPGTASTFFTCTGPYDVWYNADGSVQRANDHDEIDIEFLGKDTTRVQFNYFASGQGGHEYMYDLGFDASKDFHNYGYRWTEESITWFVDDKPVYKVLRSEIPAGEDWPEDPGRIVMNYWCGTSNAALWMGTFQDDYSSGAEYEWIASSAEPQPDPSSTAPSASGGQDVPAVGDQNVQLPDTQWAALDISAFDGWGKYTVSKDGDKVTVTHDKKLQKYDCCGVDLSLGSRNKVSYTLTNTGTEKAWAKVSIKNTSGDKSAITSATVNGGDAGYHEYGVLCELEPGRSADVVMLLDLGQKPSQLVLSLNSEADENGKALRSDMPAKGSVVLSALQAVKSDETLLPGAGTAVSGGEDQAAGGPKAPEGPDTQWAALDISAFDGWGKYTVSKDGDKVIVTHGKKLQKYDCCGTDLNLGGRNKVSYTVTNTGSEKAWAKVSIKNTSGDRSAITSATINGADAGYYEYGVLCELEPGRSADVVMLLDLAEKPSQLVLSLNSEADENGKALRSDMPAKGSVVLSALKAVKSGETALPGAAAPTQQTVPTPQGEGPKAPDAPATTLAALDLSSFDGWGKYTVVNSDSSITVSHDKTVSMYDCCGSDVALGERNKLQLTLTNTGAEKAFAKVNLKDKTDSSGRSSILSAAVDGALVDYVEYGVLCELAPGQSAQVEIYADGVHPADQLVLSLNSEGDGEGKALRGDMPAKGSVTLSQVQAVKAELPAAPDKTQPTQPDGQEPAASRQTNVPDDQWANVDLGQVDGWGKYTVTKAEGEVTVSHDKTVSMYDCCGGQIALGSRNKVRLTLTNEGKEKAFAKVNINDKTVTTGLSSLQAATVDGADAGYIEYGVLCELDPGKSAQVELLLAPGKAADQLVISLNSEGDGEGKALRSDMPKTGKVTLSWVQAVKTDETTLDGAAPSKLSQADVPLDQWLDVDLAAFDGWGMYTVEKSGAGVTMSHDKGVKQYACAGMNYAPGERNKVRMTIRNNGEKTAEAKISIKSDKVDTSAILGATIDGRPVTDATYGVMCRVPAGRSVKLVVYLDLKKDISQLVVSLNSEEGGWPTSGSITVSKVQAIQTKERFTKATGPSSGGGGGASAAPAPVTPDADGKLTLAPSSGSGWNSTSTATPAGDGGVTLSHSAPQRVYGNYSWPIDMAGNNKMELDVVNNADEKAYAKVSLTDNDEGLSVLTGARLVITDPEPVPAARFLRSRAAVSSMAALLRAGGEAAPATVLTGDAVKYGVLCELEPGQKAHLELFAAKPATKLVVSLNSEGTPDGSALDPNMPAAGSVTLKNILCGVGTAPAPVEPDPGPGPDPDTPSFTDPTTAWPLALEDWSGGKYTLTNAADTVRLSHAAAVDNWTCVGKAGLDFGDAGHLMFTVTNNAAEQAKLQFNVVHKEADGSEAKAATAATVTVDGAAQTLDVSDGVIFTLDPGKSGVARITLDPARNANQIVVFLNSMQPTDTRELAQTGDVTISEIKWDKTAGSTPVDPDPGPGEEDPVPVPTPVHEPAGEGWTDISLAGAWSSGADDAKAYTLTPSADNMALTVSHQAGVDSGACAGKGGLALNGSKEVRVKLKNNADTAASVKVNVRVDSGDSTSIVSAKINGTNFAGDPATDWGVSHTLAANGEAVFLLTLDDNETPDALTVSLNSNGSDMPAKGSVSIVTAAYKTPGGDDPEPTIPEGWEALDVSGFDGWGKYTVNKPDSKVNITHDAAVETNGCCGTDITWGGGTQARLVVKNNLADKAAYVKLNLQDSTGTGILASAKVQENALADVTWGALGVIPAGESYVYDLTVQDGKTPAKLVVSFNSEGNETMPDKGDITIVQAIYEKPTGGDTEDDGLTDMALSAFDGWGNYDVDKTNGLKLTHTSAPSENACCGMDLAPGNATTIRLTIRNNLPSTEAVVKINVKKDGGTTAVTNADITGTGAAVDSTYLEYGAKCTLQGGATEVLTLTIDPNVGADKFVVSFNSESGMSTANGDVTITSAKWNKTGEAAVATDFSAFSVERFEEEPAPLPAPAPVVEEVEEKAPVAAPPAAPTATPPADKPVADKPVADEPAVGPSGDAPAVGPDDPIGPTGEPVTDEPVADEPAVGPSGDAPAVGPDDPIGPTDKPVADEPVADEPALEGSAGGGEEEEPDGSAQEDKEQDIVTEE